MKSSAWSILLLFGLSACQYFTTDNNQLLVSVYDRELYFSEVSDLIPEGLTPEDSIAFVESWVMRWSKEQLLVHQAEMNLDETLQDVEQQLDNYRNSLLIYAYEKALVAQKMDTTIYPHEIKDYYRANKQNFELKDHIVRMVYVKVKQDAPQLNDLKKWYLSDREEDQLLLEEYCYQFAEEFMLEDTSWVYFTEVQQKTPIETNNPAEYLRTHPHVMLEDSSGIYLVRFKKYKIKESVSPLVLEEKRIKNIILNKRKLDFLKKVESDLYQKALAKGDIKYEAN